MAPAYTIIWTAARKSAPWLMKSRAIPKMVVTRARAQWTGLRPSTTPAAPPITSAAPTAYTAHADAFARASVASTVMGLTLSWG